MVVCRWLLLPGLLRCTVSPCGPCPCAGSQQLPDRVWVNGDEGRSCSFAGLAVHAGFQPALSLSNPGGLPECCPIICPSVLFSAALGHQLMVVGKCLLFPHCGCAKSAGAAVIVAVILCRSPGWAGSQPCAEWKRQRCAACAAA